MERRPVKIEGLSDKYSITEDGQVYSHIKHRYLKGAINNAGYLCYYLIGKWYFAHRMVYQVYCGKIKHEVNHIDRDKSNNHYLNLEDITHQDNIRKAREIKPWKPGRLNGWAQAEETKQKIGAANSLPIKLIDGQYKETVKDSIGKAAAYLGVSYSTVQRALKTGAYHDFPIGTYRLVR